SERGCRLLLPRSNPTVVANLAIHRQPHRCTRQRPHLVPKSSAGRPESKNFGYRVRLYRCRNQLATFSSGSEASKESNCLGHYGCLFRPRGNIGHRLAPLAYGSTGIAEKPPAVRIPARDHFQYRRFDDASRNSQSVAGRLRSRRLRSKLDPFFVGNRKGETTSSDFRGGGSAHPQAGEPVLVLFGRHLGNPNGPTSWNAIDSRSDSSQQRFGRASAENHGFPGSYRKGGVVALHRRRRSRQILRLCVDRLRLGEEPWTQPPAGVKRRRTSGNRGVGMMCCTEPSGNTLPSKKFTQCPSRAWGGDR